MISPAPNTSAPGQYEVLIADDREDVRSALAWLLEGQGYRVLLADSRDATLASVTRRSPDLVLLDLNFAEGATHGREGLDLLEALRARAPQLPVVVMTAWSSIRLAVDAMQAGARDFIEKPWDNDRLLAMVEAQLAGGQAAAAPGSEPGQELIAASTAMRSLLRVVDRVADTDANVLLLGEHGTGKELVARRLHFGSRRRDEPWVPVDLGALPEELAPAELFGHSRGAFTGAERDRRGRFVDAGRGTIFLDEIGNASPALQASLLRVVETRQVTPLGREGALPVEARLVSATNADLRARAREGSFREDLLFRLETIPLTIPPLRERPADILPLAESFCSRLGERYRRQATLTDGAREGLLAHRWPGNVRELRQAIERAVLLAPADEIRPEDLQLTPRRLRDTPDEAWAELPLAELEERRIARALAEHDQNLTRAAEALGISRHALRRRLQKS